MHGSTLDFPVSSMAVLVKVFRLISICLLAACQDAPIAPSLQPVSVTPGNPYAGSDIRISSALFASGRTPPLIFADTFLLSTAPDTSGTLLAHIPASFVGEYILRAGEPTGPIIGFIDVAGYRSYLESAHHLVGRPHPWPVGGTASLIAGLEDRSLVQFFPETGHVRTLLSDVDLNNGNARSVGVTPDPTVLLVQPWLGGNIEAWRLLPTPRLVRTFPTSNHRVIAQLSDSIFFRGSHHWIDTYALRNGRFERVYTGTYEETHGVVLSPRGDLATIVVHGSATGPPVFSTLTGDTLYHVRDSRGGHGAHFSESGDTLFFLGYERHDESAMLFALDANTGTVLKRLDLPVWVEEMLADPETGMLYLIHVEGDVTGFGQGTPHLYVVDPRTLEIVAQAAADDAAPMNCFYAAIAVDLDDVFFVCGQSTWRFDRFSRRPA